VPLNQRIFTPPQSLIVFLSVSEKNTSLAALPQMASRYTLPSHGYSASIVTCPLRHIPIETSVVKWRVPSAPQRCLRPLQLPVAVHWVDQPVPS
jgi:hypothetical protein